MYFLNPRTRVIRVFAFSLSLLPGYDCYCTGVYPQVRARLMINSKFETPAPKPGWWLSTGACCDERRGGKIVWGIGFRYEILRLGVQALNCLGKSGLWLSEMQQDEEQCANHTVVAPPRGVPRNPKTRKPEAPQTHNPFKPYPLCCS